MVETREAQTWAPTGGALRTEKYPTSRVKVTRLKAVKNCSLVRPVRSWPFQFVRRSPMWNWSGPWRPSTISCLSSHAAFSTVVVFLFKKYSGHSPGGGTGYLSSGKSFGGNVKRSGGFSGIFSRGGGWGGCGKVGEDGGSWLRS